jgi:L-rhamnose mutarotase
MKRVGFILKINQTKIAEYKKHHEAVWPEMQEALRRTGWHNYTLFIREDGLVFGYFEAEESFKKSQAAMANEPINTKWQEFMSPYFEGLGGSHPDERMVELQEYFHLD